MKMTIKAGNLKEIVKAINKDAKLAEKVLTATGRDMKSRVPGKVATDVRTVYNITKSEIMPTTKAQARKGTRKAGSIRAKGKSVTSVEIEYRGHQLSIARFGMTPKTPQEQTKDIRETDNGFKGRKQRILKPIRVTIKKGKRKTFRNAFIGKTGASNPEKTPYIAFERDGAKPYPISAIKTLSLPQMIENKQVSKLIQKDVNELLADRLNNQIRRFMK